MKKLICLYALAIFSVHVMAQNTDSVALAKQTQIKANLAVAQKLLAVKKQNPDSFFSNQLDYPLTMAYYQAGDTANFFKSANELINSTQNSSIGRLYTKTSICKLSYYVARDNHDTLKIIDYAQKRLFIYNMVRCATGEKELRVKLCDVLISIYTAQGQLTKVNELKKIKPHLAKTFKTSIPKYLSKA